MPRISQVYHHLVYKAGMGSQILQQREDLFLEDLSSQEFSMVQFHSQDNYQKEAERESYVRVQFWLPQKRNGNSRMEYLRR